MISLYRAAAARTRGPTYDLYSTTYGLEVEDLDLIMVPGVAAFLGLMALRVKHEEEVMLERFGEAYRAYMQRTGRFLPRFRT